MSPSSPPSFDAFFNHQQHGRQSSGNSMDDPYNHIQTPFTTRQQRSNDGPLTDEPPSLSRHDSSTSLRDLYGGRADSIVDRARGMHTNARMGGPIKQDSLPFDPESSSTLIATAPDPYRRSSGQQENMQYYSDGTAMFEPTSNSNYSHQSNQQQFVDQQWNMGGNNRYSQFAVNNHNYGNGNSSFVHGTPLSGMGYDLSSEPGQMPAASFLGQNSAYHAPAVSRNQVHDGGWSQDFLVQRNGTLDDGGDLTGNQNNDWASGSGTQNNMLSAEEQEQLHELERIISNTSSPGSHHLSREPSPFDQGDFADLSAQEYQVTPSPDPFLGQQRSGSLSRSGSPDPQAYSQAVSPQSIVSFHRAMTSPLSKPRSPPALIIPNQPNPSLPPILTTTAAPNANGGQGEGGVRLPAQNGGPTSRGGLLPPANPALEHLTGMAGISPVGPTTDGPMIYIQPSTPISGLKEGRGVFDAAIRRAGGSGQGGQAGQVGQGQAGWVQQQGGQQQSNFNVPPPASHPLAQTSSSDQGQNNRSDISAHQQNHKYNGSMQFPTRHEWEHQGNAHLSDLRPSAQLRPRAKSESFMGASASDLFDRQIMLSMSGDQHMQPIGNNDLQSTIDSWRATMSSGQNQNQAPSTTLDPRNLPGNQDEGAAQDYLQQLRLSQQYSQLQAQRSRLPSLSTNAPTGSSGVFKYEPGQFSPTSLAFYQQLGLNPSSASHLAGTSSAPFSQLNFQNIPQNVWLQTATQPGQSFLAPEQPGLGPRRRSFAEGTNHPASGAGTPGYGMGFVSPLQPGGMGRMRASSPGMGHRRGVQSEDFGGRGGSGWGIAGAGSTTDFLNSITPNDGLLLPPSRGRSNSHSRQSSGSSIRSVSPALSNSSQGSSYSHHSPRMEIMEEMVGSPRHQGNRRKKVAKMKVTSMATEVASTSRRTNDGVFKCPIPGCGSTFTRHFNLKGHLRSHNDERPYKCLYDGCPKSAVGFARQHDCKRHMLLHEGLRPFECEGCGKKFARLDALTRHHKSEQGQECAITHPLPVNPDGSPISESQYKIYRQQGGGPGGKFKREPSFSGYPSGDDRSGGEEDMDLGNGSGMEEYDRF